MTIAYELRKYALSEDFRRSKELSSLSDATIYTFTAIPVNGNSPCGKIWKMLSSMKANGYLLAGGMYLL